MTDMELFSLIQKHCPKLYELHPESNPRYSQNDIGYGNLFADYYKDLARFVEDKQSWYVYDGTAWRRDETGMSTRKLCKLLVLQMEDYASDMRDKTMRGRCDALLNAWSNLNTRKRLIEDAQDVHCLSSEYFDSDSNLLNCQNGVLNLRTFEFRPHSPNDFCTKVARVNYDPDARSERLDGFLNDIMVGDAETTAYLQKAAGYSLTGDTSHDCCFFLYGPTSRNGKGTFVEAFSAMMGDYAMTARSDTILRRNLPGEGGSPSEDIARLEGTRFVSIPELDKSVKLNDALLKTLTGGDTITARYLYQSSFQYRPQFKIFVHTNYLPFISDILLLKSDRVKVIPFTRHFTEEERDYGLRDELKQPENLSALLNWCLAGLRLLRAEGFKEPASVREAIADYHQSSDAIGQFIADMLVQDANSEVRSKVAYDAFQKWCEYNGHSIGTQREFTEYFRSLSTATVKTKRPREGGGATTMILGYALKSADLTGEAAS